MTDQELNEKLAKWVGFIMYRTSNLDYWTYPNGQAVTKLPVDFPNDLNAIFEWVVPELIVRYGWPLVAELLGDWTNGYISHVIKWDSDPKPATKLAEAIGQVIDKEGR